MAADAGVGEVGEEVADGAAVIRERGEFAVGGRRQGVGVVGQFVVVQAGAEVVDAVEGFVEQGDRKQAAGRGIADDAAGRAAGGVAAEADVFHRLIALEQQFREARCGAAWLARIGAAQSSSHTISN